MLTWLTLLLFSPNDIIIALMGVSGAGKSSFIQLLTKEEVVIGDGFSFCRYLQSKHWQKIIINVSFSRH